MTPTPMGSWLQPTDDQGDCHSARDMGRGNDSEVFGPEVDQHSDPIAIPTRVMGNNPTAGIRNEGGKNTEVNVNINININSKIQAMETAASSSLKNIKLKKPKANLCIHHRQLHGNSAATTESATDVSNANSSSNTSNSSRHSKEHSRDDIDVAQRLVGANINRDDDDDNSDDASTNASAVVCKLCEMCDHDDNPSSSPLTSSSSSSSASLDSCSLRQSLLLRKSDSFTSLPSLSLEERRRLAKEGRLINAVPTQGGAAVAKSSWTNGTSQYHLEDAHWQKRSSASHKEMSAATAGITASTNSNNSNKASYNNASGRNRALRSTGPRTVGQWRIKLAANQDRKEPKEPKEPKDPKEPKESIIVPTRASNRSSQAEGGAAKAQGSSKADKKRGLPFICSSKSKSKSVSGSLSGLTPQGDATCSQEQQRQEASMSSSPAKLRPCASFPFIFAELEAPVVSKNQQHALSPANSDTDDEIDELDDLVDEELSDINLQSMSPVSPVAMRSRACTADKALTVKCPEYVNIPCVNSAGITIMRKLKIKATWFDVTGQGLRSVDFSPMLSYSGSGSFQLVEVSLAANNLDSIDLSPLSVCPKLESLRLNGNCIKAMDLSPLSLCQNLKRLWLQNNMLSQIDIRPLAACPNLSSLYLDSNRIHEATLDLEQLGQISNLRSLRLEGNQLSGQIDVTPLLKLDSLVSFSISDDVQMFLSCDGHEGEDKRKLSAALRRLQDKITWKSILNQDEINCALAEEKLKLDMQKKLQEDGVNAAPNFVATMSSSRKALLINFKLKDFYSTRDLMDKYAHFTCIGISDVLYEHDGLNNYDILMVYVSKDVMLGIQSIKEIRMICPYVPVICVVDASTLAAASKLIGAGADRVVSNHLSKSDSKSFEELAEQRSVLRFHQRGSTVRAASLSAIIDDDSLLMRNSDSLIAIRQGVLPPLTSLSRSQTMPPGAIIGGCARQNLEQQALEKLLVRYNMVARRDQFAPITTLCGLPSVVAPLLFSAVLVVNQVDETPESEIPLEMFMRFWSDEFRHRGPDQRLFRIFHFLRARSGSRYGNVNIISKGILRGMRGNVGSEPDIVNAVSALIVYSCSGKAFSESHLTERGMRRVLLCARLIAAESGLFEGPLAVMEPTRLAEYRMVYESLGGRIGETEENSKGLQLDQLEALCKARGTLIPRACCSVFSAACSSNGSVAKTDKKAIYFADFVRFWVAVHDVAKLSATEYWFSVLDVDMDGFVSREDAQHFYSEKVSIRKSEGAFLCDFQHLWSSIVDLVAPQNHEKGLSLKEFLVLQEKHRGFVIQALMFLQDGNIVLDVRKTGNVTIL
eukprot:CAMPEP_0184693134 /NCGR_PEP_ID=MMETSP0313-20130426/1413_1 /TAXON_ID=2792 /ORGANISM="Porphyridium aerugineum, Strain SAG 1380-2" /LENGTH=1323 /DNA_ID=CAMNT_0027151107 /DNA_START=505 /DNA_END=4476 /DNA_ORIENTATION=-